MVLYRAIAIYSGKLCDGFHLGELLKWCLYYSLPSFLVANIVVSVFVCFWPSRRCLAFLYHSWRLLMSGINCWDVSLFCTCILTCQTCLWCWIPVVYFCCKLSALPELPSWNVLSQELFKKLFHKTFISFTFTQYTAVEYR